MFLYSHQDQPAIKSLHFDNDDAVLSPLIAV